MVQFRTPLPVICLLFAAASVSAQPAAAPLTAVSLFRVQPDRMERFVEVVQVVTPALEKLRQAGTLEAYGLDADVFHLESPNVALWYTAKNFAGISEGERAIQEALRANADKAKDAYSITDFDKHRDLLVRSLERGQGKIPAGALPVTFFQQEKVKPGKMAVARMMFQHYAKPVQEQLVRDGVINCYSMDVEALHTIGPKVVWFLILAPDPGAMDKVRDAFTAAQAKLPDAERRAFDEMEDEVCDRKAHRDSVSRAIIFRSR